MNKVKHIFVIIFAKLSKNINNVGICAYILRVLY